MAIQRIPGNMLQSNLERNGVDLAFETNLLYLDVVNGRVGIGTSAPQAYKLDVNGTAQFRDDVLINGDLTVNGTTTTIDSQNLSVEDNILVINSNNSAETDSGIMINRGSANDPAVLYWDETLDVFRAGTTTSDGSTVTDLTGVTLSRIQAAAPVAGDDLVTKTYFDANSSNISDGTQITLGTVTDGSWADGAYTGLDATRTVTDAIDDLNETMENIRENTYVQSVDFTADVTAGSAGLTVTLTITTVGGGADEYDINWGTGETPTTATSDSTPSHTYNSNTNSPFTVTVTARASGAVTGSAGSFATKTRTNYIIIYTAAPTVNFFMYAAASGGSPITTADTGSTVYLENVSTNTTVGTVTYSVNWGDGSGPQPIASDSAAGGVSGTRLSHTYTNSAGDDGSTVAGTGAGDTRFQITLTLASHTTADPAEIPKSQSKNFDVYSTHSVAYSAAGGVVRGVNEESTSGFPVTFTNNTTGDPGPQSVFTSNVYTWNFGEGDANTNVNVGSGASGDTGNTIANTFNLSSGQQAAGTTVTYNTSLSLANGHSTSPFTANLNIIVEPDVRANIAATAVTVSTGTGNNQYTLYDGTDLDSNNRALARFTNTSQNADDYDYDYFDDSSDIVNIIEDGVTAGSIGATLDKNFAGTSPGAFTTRFRAHGTPDTIEQDDEENINWTMKAVPSAPAGLSSKSITLADSAQGTSPKLCAGFDDNTSTFTTLTAGDSLNTSTARRYTTTTTIDTSVASNFYNGASGTLSAAINASADGSKAFTTAENETGTFTSLVVSSNVDYDTVDTSYPQRFYLVASAKITKNLSAYTVGVNAQRLEHTATGNTNLVYVVKDDITATPTTTIGTVFENNQGTVEWISGIPYYDSGSPSLTVSGTTVANFTGQSYADISDPHEIDPGTVSEGSGSIISNLNYTYADVDGAPSMLTGGIPNTDTGVSSAYTLGNVTVPLTSSSMFSVSTIKARSANCNGDGAYSEDTNKIQVFTATPGGLNKDQGGIIVDDNLGATYDDDAVRITGFGTASDTPSFYDSSNANYYTDHAWSGNAGPAGTQEATVRPTGISTGIIRHDTTDYSSGYLPAGPNRSTDTGAQYYTFAFRRTSVANFTITLTGTVSGVFIAAPGTQIDSTSTLNGWLDASIQYAGSGVPGADTGAGGNGSNGCAFTGGDRILDGVSYSAQSFTLTLGSENMSNASGNNVLVRIKLESGDSVTALSIA
jgi:hypothetical protein